MNPQVIIALAQSFLPVLSTLEAGIGMFIHNSASQNEFAITIGKINQIAEILLPVASTVLSAVQANPAPASK